MSDISSLAVNNSNINIKKLFLNKKVKCVQSDLYKNIKGKFDFIVFNHPFFIGKFDKEDTIALSMKSPSDLIERFLEDSHKFLRPGGIIMMPFYALADKVNNPCIRAKEFGFIVSKCFETIPTNSKQKGKVFIYELKSIY